MSNNYYPTDELHHYGVIGMRWGVRRSKKELARAQNASERDKALSKLNKHREKAANKVNSLNRQNARLQTKAARNDTMASIYARKAAREKSAAHGPTSLMKTKIQKRYHEFQSVRAQSKSARRMSAASRYKTLMSWKQKSINAFQKEINKIDALTVESGKRFIDGNSSRSFAEVKEEIQND